MRVSRTITMDITVVNKILTLAGEDGFTDFIEAASKEKLAAMEKPPEQQIPKEQD